MITLHISRHHIGLIGIQTCDHPHSCSELYHYAMAAFLLFTGMTLMGEERSTNISRLAIYPVIIKSQHLAIQKTLKIATQQLKRRT